MKYDKLYYEKVKPGDIFKNYKVLCPVFGFAPTTGKSRILQMNVIDSLIRYKKVGYSFHITEVLQPDGTWSTLETLESAQLINSRTMPKDFCMFKAAKCASDIRKLERMPEPYYVPNTVLPNTTVETYRDFCSIMGIRYRLGGSKASDLKNMHKYMSFQQMNANFKITDIYVAPIEYFTPAEYPERFAASRQHTSLIEYMLVSYLYRNQSASSDAIITPKQNIIKDLNLILMCANDFDLKNELFNRIDNTPALEDDMKRKYFEDSLTIQFMLYQKASQLLQNALSSVRSKNLFSVHEKYYILEANASNPRQGTNDEIKIIRNLQKAQLASMGVNSMFSILVQKRRSAYYDGLRQKYLQHGWVTVKQELEFIPCRDFLLYHATDTELSSYRRQISSFIKNYMYRKIMQENESYLKHLSRGDVSVELDVKNKSLYQIAHQPKNQCQSELKVLLDVLYR